MALSVPLTEDKLLSWKTHCHHHHHYYYYYHYYHHHHHYYNCRRRCCCHQYDDDDDNNNNNIIIIIIICFVTLFVKLPFLIMPSCMLSDWICKVNTTQYVKSHKEQTKPLHTTSKTHFSEVPYPQTWCQSYDKRRRCHQWHRDLDLSAAADWQAKVCQAEDDERKKMMRRRGEGSKRN